MKLSQEAAALADWTLVRDFAAQIYGKGKAIKIRIETYEEYDDENYSYPIGFIGAYDSEDNRLSPDYSLPFFASAEWQRVVSAFDEDDNIASPLKEISVPHSKRQSFPYLLIEDLPQNSASYDLTTTPVLTLPLQEAP